MTSQFPKAPSKCSVRFETVDGTSVEVIVTNTATGKEDRFSLSAHEHGPAYMLHLAKVTQDGLVGCATFREAIDRIGSTP